jgi:hypothetical protein
LSKFKYNLLKSQTGRKACLIGGGGLGLKMTCETRNYTFLYLISNRITTHIRREFIENFNQNILPYLRGFDLVITLLTAMSSLQDKRSNDLNAIAINDTVDTFVHSALLYLAHYYSIP